jgi:hypothetical protein
MRRKKNQQCIVFFVSRKNLFKRATKMILLYLFLDNFFHYLNLKKRKKNPIMVIIPKCFGWEEKKNRMHFFQYVFMLSMNESACPCDI